MQSRITPTILVPSGGWLRVNKHMHRRTADGRRCLRILKLPAHWPCLLSFAIRGSAGQSASSRTVTGDPSRDITDCGDIATDGNRSRGHKVGRQALPINPHPHPPQPQSTMSKDVEAFKNHDGISYAADDPPATGLGDLDDETSREKLTNSYVDEAYNTYLEHQAEAIPPEEARSLRIKIDKRLLPLLFMVYFLQYFDKSTLNFSSVYGLQKDLHLVGQDYAWLGSIFYFGYMVAQPLFGYLAQRLPIAKVLSFCIIVWGITVITTPGCKSFAGIAANRFILGVLEAGVTPGFILITSMWWLAKEQPMRTEIWYCANGFATMCGGLIGYGVGHITGGLAQWMYIYLIMGSVSICCGVVFLIFMPDSPTKARFLTDHEKVVAVKRVASNKTGVENKHFKKHQLWEVARDPKSYILFIMSIAAQIPNAAQGSFGSLIISGFGFSVLNAQLLQLPSGALQIVSLLLGGYIASRFKDVRSIVMLVGNGIGIVAGAGLVAIPNENKWGRLVCFWLLSIQSVGFTIALTIISSNVAGYTKKQVTGALLFIGYSVGNIAGPQFFKKKEAPHYTTAYISLLIGYCIKFVMVAVLYAYMWSENRRRDKQGLTTDEQDQKAILLGLKDLTENENLGFRYKL